MEPAPEHIDELIARDVADALTADERSQLVAWLHASPQNKAYYHDLKKLLASVAAPAEFTVDTEKAWQHLNQRINNAPKIIPLFSRRVLTRIAAVMAFVAGLYVTYLVLQPVSEPTLTISAQASPVKRQLPDGSQVTVSENSKIEFVTGKKGRHVTLTGEAHFEVKHDDAQPFVIDAGGIFIEDIGTAFQVRALPESDTVFVAVDEGEVRFFLDSINGINLTAGESAICLRAEKSLKKMTVAGREKTQRAFNFTDEPLSEVIAAINNAYGINITFENNALGRCRISAAFHNEQPEVILEVIAQTLDLTVSGSDGAYQLNGKSCDE